MKIEKLNENQIRCTLNPQDLRERELKLSELAYGSEKAKELFRDMMQEAFQEYGFEADDIPLMIEAIPTSPESIILLITKIENPEELDTRFSNFTPYQNPEEDEEEETSLTPFTGEVLEQLNQLHKSILSDFLEKRSKAAEKKHGEDKGAAAPKAEDAPAPLRAFIFRSLPSLIGYARTVRHVYSGEGTLYKNPSDASYVLCLSAEGVSADAFNRACNLACEYGVMLENAPLAFYEEHYQKVLEENTIRQLAKL